MLFKALTACATGLQPGAHGDVVTGSKRLFEPQQAFTGCCQSGEDGLAVMQQDVAPHVDIPARDTGGVAEARGCERCSCGPELARSSRCQHVRQMRGLCDRAIMIGW